MHTQDMRPLLAFAFAFLALPLPIAQQQTDAHATLPSITSYALDKSKVTIPSEFAGRLNILLLLFRRDQQAAVDAWNDPVSKILVQQPEVKSYTLPVFQRVNILSRMYLNASMRSNSSDPSRFHTTIPLYVDKASFLQDIQVDSEKQIALLIADKQGRIYWHATGTPTSENQAALAGALATALARH